MIWKELNDNLVFHNLKASDNIEVLQLMGDAMIQEGYGEEGFTEAVLEREKDYPTGLDVERDWSGNSTYRRRTCQKRRSFQSASAESAN